jgi:hypothetical protein
MKHNFLIQPQWFTVYLTVSFYEYTFRKEVKHLNVDPQFLLWHSAFRSKKVELLFIIINNFKAWANWSIPRQLSTCHCLVLFSALG